MSHLKIAARGHGILPLRKPLNGESVLKEVQNAEDLYRGSYMSAHVLLNLLNNLRKRDKMQGLPSILSLFRNKFNKSNNTGARMLDSIYHRKFKLFKIAMFGMKKSRFCHLLFNVIMDVITSRY